MTSIRKKGERVMKEWVVDQIPRLLIYILASTIGLAWLTTQDVPRSVVTTSGFFLIGLGLGLLALDAWRRRRLFRLIDETSPSQTWRYLVDIEPLPFAEGRLLQQLAEEMRREEKRFSLNVREQTAARIRFIEKWAHEIEAPLEALRTLARATDDIPNEQEEMLFDQIDSLLDEVVYVARLEGGDRRPTTLKRTSLKRVTEMALKRHKPFLLAQQAIVGIDADDVTVISDPKQLTYLIEQLIEQMIQNRSALGPFKLSFEAETTDEATTLRIRSNGKPVAPEGWIQLFDDHDDHEQATPGLGLAHIYDVAHALRVSVYVTTDSEDRPVFTLHWPRT